MPFPGQTATEKANGFTADGKYDVEVDVTGTPYGKPDEHFVTWIVHVTFDVNGDCP